MRGQESCRKKRARIGFTCQPSHEGSGAGAGCQHQPGRPHEVSGEGQGNELLVLKAQGSAIPRGQESCRRIVFHGDRDKTVNPVNGDQVIVPRVEPNSAPSAASSTRAASTLTKAVVSCWSTGCFTEPVMLGRAGVRRDRTRIPKVPMPAAR